MDLSVVPQTVEQTHLETANRHIEAALDRLAWLEGVLLEQQRQGIDASVTESLMHNMKLSLCTMIRHRLSIRRNLAQSATTPCIQEGWHTDGVEALFVPAE